MEVQVLFTAPIQYPLACLGGFVLVVTLLYLVRCLAIYPPGVYTQVMIRDLKQRAIHRSRVIEGQFKALETAIASEQYCVDILTQSLAIQRSLASLNKLILENHIRTHIRDGLASSNVDQQEQAVTELLKLYELHNVRTRK